MSSKWCKENMEESLEEGMKEGPPIRGENISAEIVKDLLDTLGKELKRKADIWSCHPNLSRKEMLYCTATALATILGALIGSSYEGKDRDVALEAARIHVLLHMGDLSADKASELLLKSLEELGVTGKTIRIIQSSSMDT